MLWWIKCLLVIIILSLYMIITFLLINYYYVLAIESNNILSCNKPCISSFMRALTNLRLKLISKIQIEIIL